MHKLIQYRVYWYWYRVYQNTWYWYSTGCTRIHDIETDTGCTRIHDIETDTGCTRILNIDIVQGVPEYMILILIQGVPEYNWYWYSTGCTRILLKSGITSKKGCKSTGCSSKLQELFIIISITCGSTAVHLRTNCYIWYK